MVYKRLVVFTVAAIVVTAFSVLPVDARAKKKTKHRADATTLSLDGRNTGGRGPADSTRFSTTG